MSTPSDTQPPSSSSNQTHSISIAAMQDAGLVLVVEDERRIALIVRKRLESAGIRVIIAENGELGLQKAIDENPDLIVTDWCMPKMDGPALCQALRNHPHPEMNSTYIIILSSRHEPNDRVAGLRAGADDYLAKDQNHEELVARVEAGLRIRKLQKQLTEQARTDGLTGLMNRSHFYDRLDQELDRSQRYEETTTLAMIDLDRFKQINDTAGHQAGDEAIRFAATALQRACRTSDLVCRYGGDEFAVLFINAKGDAAASILERIRDDLEHSPFCYEGTAHPFGLSYGLCEATPAVPRSRDDLIRSADMALYEMKRQGAPSR